MGNTGDDSAAAQAAAARYDAIYNRWFLGAIFRKEYPALALEGLGPHMPAGWQDDMEVIGQPVDWCGLNYYTPARWWPPTRPWPHYAEVDGPLPKTQMGWEIYPDGLEKFLLRAQAEYARGLPIYVTENGMASPEVPVVEGEVDDPERTDYLTLHLHAVQRAIAKGANVRGYFCWSLMDNFEWSLGYEKRFGLVHVDFDSLKRTPKSSYHALARALARNA